MAVCLWVIKWRCVCLVRSMHTSLGDILWRGRGAKYVYSQVLVYILEVTQFTLMFLCCPDSWKPYLKQFRICSFHSNNSHPLLNTFNVPNFKKLGRIFKILTTNLLPSFNKMRKQLQKQEVLCEGDKATETIWLVGRLNLHYLNSGSRANNRRRYLDQLDDCQNTNFAPLFMTGSSNQKQHVAPD